MFGTAGAGLKIVVTPASCAMERARSTVARGISSWHISTDAERMMGATASTSSGVKEELASPEERIILFCPDFSST